MGVKISDIVPKHDLNMAEIQGKVIAVDAMNTLYQFFATIRQPDGTPLKDSKGQVTSHLSGVFYRTINLMQQNVQLVYVFDGKAPEFKKREQEKRKQVRDKAYEMWKIAQEKGDLEEARKYAQASIKITGEMIEEAKGLLTALGIPIVQAPSEGEAQAAYMTTNGQAYASASSDLDSLLFGAKRLVRNLNISGKRKIPNTNMYRDIVPEMILLEDVLATNQLTQTQLINVAILVGTDYNPGGIKGIGAKKALKLVKETESIDQIVKNLPWEFDISPSEIQQFFLNPPVEKLGIEKPEFSEERVRKILIESHDFSPDRVSSMLAKLNELKELRKQKTLFSFK